MTAPFNLGTYVDRVARRWSGRTALVTERGEYTYGELDRATNAVATGLRSAGVGRRDRVGLLLPNSREFVLSYFAVQKLGAVAVPVNFRSSPREVDHVLEAAEVAGLIYDGAYDETVEGLSFDSGFRVRVGDGEFESLLEGPVEDLTCPAARSDLAYIAHTSGSTGLPKLVPHTHDDALLGGSQGIHEVGLRRTDVGLALAPLFHTAGMYTFFVPHLFAGGTAIVQRDFDPERTMELIEERGATGVFGVPAQYRALLRVPGVESYDTSSVRYVRTGASPITEETVARVREVLAEAFYNTYGLTECQQNVTIVTPEDPDGKERGLGKASYFWETRVVEPAEPAEVDPDAEIDPPGTGLLLVNGPMTMEGYLDRPERTDEVLVGDWVYTEDIVEVDEDGYLFILDRMNNMIKSRGESIYPQEVEGVLGEHPGVLDCGVFGREHEQWDEAVVAAVVVEDGVGEADLDEYLKASDELADYKRPRAFVFVDEIPRNPGSGSIQREKLRDL